MEDSLQSRFNFDEGTQEVDDPESSMDAEFVDFQGGTEVVDYPEDIFQSQDRECVLAGETQVLDDFDDVIENGDENHEGETQVVEEHDCIEDFGSQLVSDCNDRAVIRSDRMIPGKEAAREDIVQHQRTSGSSQLSFTSVRAAALHASGLAARPVPFDWSDNVLCRIGKNSSPLGLEPVSNVDNRTSSLTCLPKMGDEADLTFDLRECDNPKEVLGRSEGSSSCSPARELVTENKECANEECDTLGRADLGLLPDHDNGLAGLSYVDSQEPGDLSQASALGFVDKFLEVNDFCFTNELDHGRCTEPDPQSCVKGSLSLAKRVKSRDAIKQVGAFVWNDNQEDEGGGDFFSRMKDEICKSKRPGQRHLPRSKKSEYCSKGQIKLKETLSKVPSGEEDSTNSVSRLILLTPKETEGAGKASETNMKRNLSNKFNECSERSPKRGSAEACTSNNMFSVGPDTQIAAEAMEILLHAEPLANCDPDDDYSVKGSYKCLPGEKRANEVSPELCCTPKRRKSCLDSAVVTRESRMGTRNRAWMKERKHEEGAPKRSCLDKVPSAYSITKLRGHNSSPSIDKMNGVSNSKVLIESDRADKLSNSSTEKGTCQLMTNIPRRERNRSTTCLYPSKLLNSKDNSSKSGRQSGEVEDLKLDNHDSEVAKFSVNTNYLSVKAVWYPRRTRSPRSPPVQAEGSWTLHSSSMFSDQKDSKVHNIRQRKFTVLAGKNVEPPNETCGIRKSNKSDWKNEACCIFPCDCDGVKGARLDLLPKMRSKHSDLPCLSPGMPNSTFLSRDSRRRREMTAVRVLFSRHLDDDIIKHQKKILSRLGASVASSMSDATHFIADEFTRTRNMLEAIAFGKPVVTHLWLESCNQTSCFIDERSYILRDEKKEKEIGFSMPVTLARSWQNPLLQNQRVLITQNVKPGKDIICSLVKVVNGQIVEKTGRPTLKEIASDDDLLVISCEEDYAICEHFFDKGVPVYSSELILNGIVTQKLDYERHRLFEDRVPLKRTHLPRKTVLSCR